MNRFLCGFFILMAILLFACGEQAPPGEEEQPTVAQPPEEAEQPIDESLELARTLWEEELSGMYHEWGLMPGTTEMQAAAEGAVHGVKITIYINEDAASAAEAGADVMPDGAFIVKDGFNEDDSLKHIAVMKKIDGKWFWAVYHSDESVAVADFDIDMCVGCHTTAGGKDLVATWK